MDLKDNCPPDLKQSHYLSSIETIEKALFTTLDRIEGGSKKKESEDDEDDIN